jgi:hypothetical protein
MSSEFFALRAAAPFIVPIAPMSRRPSRPAHIAKVKFFRYINISINLRCFGRIASV